MKQCVHGTWTPMKDRQTRKAKTHEAADSKADVLSLHQGNVQGVRVLSYHFAVLLLTSLTSIFEGKIQNN